MTQDAQPQKKPTADRVPIRIEKLILVSANAYGLKVPDGTDGRGERIIPHLTAGIQGDVKTEIEHRPWLRMYRVQKSRRITQTENGRSVELWHPMGRAFQVPETLAVAVLADE